MPILLEPMNSIQCPRCGAAATYGAPGCTSCGAAFVPPPGGHSRAPFAGVKPKSGWAKKAWGVGGTLAALATIGLAGGFFVPKLASAGKSGSTDLKSTSSSKANVASQADLGAGPNLADLAGGEGPDLTSTLASTSSPLKTEAAAPAPALAVPSAPAPSLASNSGMPQDVHDWLEHLRRTESSRSALAQQQITEGMTALTEMQAQKMNAALDQDANDDPSASLRNKASGLTARLQSAWASLQSGFDAKAAPADCATAKAEYDATLAATGQMMVELISAINSAAQDPQAALSALRSMQGTSGNRIDTHASATDSEVGNICAKYQTPKWFSISKDIGDGSLLSKIGIE